jgi:hypothetical protein
MVSRGSVRTAARRRMGTEREVAVPVCLEMDLQDLRRMEVEVARRRTCGHVVMLFFQRGVRRGRRDACVFAGCQFTICLFVSVRSVMWVALSRSEVRRVLSWRVKWARIVEAWGW